MKYTYNNIAILGLGITGKSLYDYFLNSNVNMVIWDDNKEVRLKYQNNNNQVIHYKDWDFTKLEVIFVSPGIALEHPKQHFVLLEAKKFNIPLICDVEAFLDKYPTLPSVALTGTNGKSTTLGLIEHIFILNLLSQTDANAKAPMAGGNIGMPIFSYANLLDNNGQLKDGFSGYQITNLTQTPYQVSSFLHKDKINILELSSYQLELMHNHHINCALILNIQPDHLEHHGNFDNYIKAKKRILLNQTANDYAIINQSCLHQCEDALGDQKLIIIHNDYVKNGIYIKNNTLFDNYFANNKPVFDFTNLYYINGEHNYYNIAFAYAVAKIHHIDELKIQEYILSFKGLKHRQTLVNSFNNIKFINDSKATNPESTYYALNAFDNIALILGGIRKRDDLDILIPFLKDKVLKVFLIGNRRTNLKTIEIFKNILESNQIDYEISYILSKAIYHAYDFLNKLDIKPKTLLLSPACASMDQFKNFEHRGDRFTKIVDKLILSHNSKGEQCKGVQC